MTVFDKIGQQLTDNPTPEAWTGKLTFAGKDRHLLFMAASSRPRLPNLLETGQREFRAGHRRLSVGVDFLLDRDPFGATHLAAGRQDGDPVHRILTEDGFLPGSLFTTVGLKCVIFVRPG